MEYDHRERGREWYWSLGIIAAAAAATALILGNFLFAILIAIGTFTLMLYQLRHPDRVTILVDRRGVRVGNKLYPYEHLESFWINRTPGRKKLSLMSRKALMPLISIPLHERVDADQLEDYLLHYLDAQEHKESLSEAVAEFFGLM